MAIKVLLTIHGNDVHEPIIYTIGKQFDVIPNVEGASVTEGVGLVAMELLGEQEEIDRVLSFLREKKITVEILE